MLSPRLPAGQCVSSRRVCIDLQDFPLAELIGEVAHQSTRAFLSVVSNRPEIDEVR